jgi:membrane protease YdiL (CAAX protease family)
MSHDEGIEDRRDKTDGDSDRSDDVHHEESVDRDAPPQATDQGVEPPPVCDEYELRPVDAAPAPAKPRIWTIGALLLVGVVVYFIAVAVGLLTSMGIHVLASGTLPGEYELLSSNVTQLLMVLFGHGSILALVVAAALASPRPWHHRLGFVKPAISWWAMIPFVLGSFAFAWIDLFVLALFFERPSDHLMEMMETFSELRGPSIIPAVAAIGLLVGLSEEALCRGYIQMRLVRRWGALVGIGVSSVIFGAIHIDPQHVLVAAISGVWFGVLAWRTASVWPPVICHAAFNSLSVIGSSFDDQTGATTYRDMLAETTPFSIAFGIVCGASLVMSIWLLIRCKPRPEPVLG